VKYWYINDLGCYEHIINKIIIIIVIVIVIIILFFYKFIINSLYKYEKYCKILWVVMGIYKCPVATPCNPLPSSYTQNLKKYFFYSLYFFTIIHTNGK